MPEEEIGVVTHYFGHISVGALKITNGTLSVGDQIHIKGAHDDIKTTVESMQIEHDQVKEAKVGDEVGIKVPEKVHENDKVYKITE
jgi:putative protease